MSDETRLPEVSGTVELETEEDELEASRKDGVGMLDDMIGIHYDQFMAAKKKELKVGDMIKLIDLRYRLSPTSADQIKFWKHLDKVRRKHLKRMEEQKNRKQLQGTRGPEKKDENVKE